MLEGVSEQQNRQTQAIAALQSQLQAVQQEVSGLARTVEAGEERLHTRLQRAEGDLSDRFAAGWGKLSTDIANTTGAVDRAIAEAVQIASRQHAAAVQEVRTSAESLRSSVEAASAGASETAQITARHLEAVRDRLNALQSGLDALAGPTGQSVKQAEGLAGIADQIMPMNSQFFHLVSEIRTRVDEIGRDMDNLIASNMAAVGKATPRLRDGKAPKGGSDG